MAENPIVGLRVPADLLQKIDLLIGSEGKNRTEVILALVRKGLGIQLGDTGPLAARLEELEGKWQGC